MAKQDVYRMRVLAIVAALGLVVSAVGARVSLMSSPPMPPAGSGLRIPASVRAEHDAIHSALENATHAPGQVGIAARELAKVLHPHSVREEEIALPPLGVLAALANGAPIEDNAAVMKMSDTLKAELPRMLEEHVRIRHAVAALRSAARSEHQPEYERLADSLALHAESEEDVLYPAAVLAGEVIRLRKQ